MRPTYRSIRRLGLSLAGVALACADATSSRSRTAVFVLRSLGGEQVPATILSGGTSYVVLADTLFIDTPAGVGVLRRSTADAYDAAPPQLQRGAHQFIWRGADLSVFFACQAGQPCLAIFAYRQGTISGRELRFPTDGALTPERRYEQVR